MVSQGCNALQGQTDDGIVSIVKKTIQRRTIRNWQMDMLKSDHVKLLDTFPGAPSNTLSGFSYRSTKHLYWRSGFPPIFSIQVLWVPWEIVGLYPWIVWPYGWKLFGYFGLKMDDNCLNPSNISTVDTFTGLPQNSRKLRINDVSESNCGACAMHKEVLWITASDEGLVGKGRYNGLW